MERIQETLRKAIRREQVDTDLEPLDDYYIPGKWNVLSLFSGCGGLDLGVLSAGDMFTIVHAIDNCRVAMETHKANISSAFHDVRDIRKVQRFSKCDIVVGGFPCPGFSVAGPRLLDDPRNFLYIHFIRALIQTRPKIFVAENVKSLLSMGKGQSFQQMIEDFSAAGYWVVSQLLNTVNYGVPSFVRGSS